MFPYGLWERSTVLLVMARQFCSNWLSHIFLPPSNNSTYFSYKQNGAAILLTYFKSVANTTGNQSINEIMEPISDVSVTLQSIKWIMVSVFITMKDMRSKFDLILFLPGILKHRRSENHNHWSWSQNIYVRKANPYSGTFVRPSLSKVNLWFRRNFSVWRHNLIFNMLLL